MPYTPRACNLQTAEEPAVRGREGVEEKLDSGPEELVQNIQSDGLMDG